MKKYVEDVVLVSDTEIIEATRALYSVGLLVDPSGAAALAAVRAGKISDLTGKKSQVTRPPFCFSLCTINNYDKFTICPHAHCLKK